MKKYWILTEIHSCPVCLREVIYKERIYNKPKPKDWNKRNIFHESYDYCDVWER